MENINYIYGDTPQGELITFDGFRVESYAIYEDEEEGTLVDLLFKSGNSVEYYTTENDGDGLIKLHFLSGHVVEVFSELDEDLYPGESVDTLVDKCICRYFDDKD